MKWAELTTFDMTLKEAVAKDYRGSGRTTSLGGTATYERWEVPELRLGPTPLAQVAIAFRDLSHFIEEEISSFPNISGLLGADVLTFLQAKSLTFFAPASRETGTLST